MIDFLRTNSSLPVPFLYIFPGTIIDSELAVKMLVRLAGTPNRFVFSWKSMNGRNLSVDFFVAPATKSHTVAMGPIENPNLATLSLKHTNGRKQRSISSIELNQSRRDSIASRFSRIFAGSLKIYSKILALDFGLKDGIPKVKIEFFLEFEVLDSRAKSKLPLTNGVFFKSP